jgi:Tfp pilus assembly protein PilP
LRLCGRQQGESLHTQNWCAEIRLRAERRAAELPSDMDEHPPAQPREIGSTTTPILPLVDLDITKMQSSRWQPEASVLEEELEQYVAEKHEKRDELTNTGLRRLARNLRKEDGRSWECRPT